MSIQVAKALGARVATTVRSPAKAEVAKEAGADLVIDSTATAYEEAVRDWTGGRGVDVVIENLGGDHVRRSIDCLRPLGTLVSLGFVTGEDVTFNIPHFYFAHKQIRGTLMGDREDLEWSLEQVAEGRIKAQVVQVLPLAEASEAHRRMAAGTVRANLVLSLIQAMRSSAGEQMVLEQNIFVEQVLPSFILRKLTDEELAEYRRPYLEPGESRRPTLTWPRQIPFDGEPDEVHQIVDDYSRWLPTTPFPKLFVNPEPGVITAMGATRDFCRGFSNQTELSVKGLHYVQEDAPDDIGRALADWLDRIS